MHRSRKDRHHQPLVIVVDAQFIPMSEVTRRHALKALASGRAVALDLKTWSKLGLLDVAGRPFHVIVFPNAKAIAEARLGVGKGTAGIMRRDRHRCQYCGARASTLDHVQPRCQGGATSWSNLVAACSPCNQRKGGRTPAEAGMKLITPVRSPRYHLMEKFHALVRGE